MAEKKFDPALVENRSSEEKFAYMFQFLLDSVVESAKDVMSEEELAAIKREGDSVLAQYKAENNINTEI
jgi:hypothetical protein